MGDKVQTHHLLRLMMKEVMMHILVIMMRIVMIMMKIIVMVQMICWMNWENKEIYSERIVECMYTHEQYTYEYTNLFGRLLSCKQDKNI